MPRDVYRFINDLDDAALDRIVSRLEFRATDPTFTAYRDAYFAKLPLAAAQRVLALGCGTGVEVRALKRHPEFRGDVVGIDHSPRLVEEARRRTEHEGLTAAVEYRVGDAHALDLADASFDIVLEHTLLSHVTEPAVVLGEGRRVVKPGGMIAVFDGDFASLAFAYPDRDLAERVEAALLDQFVQNPRVMRDMPHLLQRTGVELVDATAHAYADVGVGRFFANFCESYGGSLTGSAALADEEIERWREWQAQALTDGTFFGASNFYTYLARRR
jgi:ubiquinone/menaquinone biosynthesis C-methylase UbiE